MVFVSWSPSTITVGTETTATITFNDDDVSWVYIDWGDGEDNSLDKAIYHWERLKTDAKTIDLSDNLTKNTRIFMVALGDESSLKSPYKEIIFPSNTWVALV